MMSGLPFLDNSVDDTTLFKSSKCLFIYPSSCFLIPVFKYNKYFLPIQKKIKEMVFHLTMLILMPILNIIFAIDSL